MSLNTLARDGVMVRRAHCNNRAEDDCRSFTSPHTLLPPLSPSHPERVESPKADDARCETILWQSRSPSYNLRSSPRRAKVYPRLQTLEQLVERRVEAMHDGNFVGRSEARWQSFKGALEVSYGVLSRELDSDKVRAYQIVRQSSALVIQSYWRQFAATLLRRRLTAMMWKRQEDTAAWITASAEPFRVSLDMSTSRPKFLSTAIHGLCRKYGWGLYYHLPASLLSWWMRISCARTSGRFLRRPPVVFHAIDIPVSRSMKLSAHIWRAVSSEAATIIQSAVRSFFARQLMSRLRMDKRRSVAAIRLQCFFRMMLAHQLVNQYRRRRAALKIQCCWRCKCARSLSMRRRAVRCALSFTRKLLADSVDQVATLIYQRAAIAIQKSYRASRARACFRQLASESQQRSWRQNPSKGFALFARMRYSEAALQLETCRRQGGFQKIDGLIESMQANQGRPPSVTTAPTFHSESRMSFSFSAAPTTLGADWTLGAVRTSDWVHEGVVTTRIASYLQFWHAYALSHFFTFEATGDQFNLRQARFGFEKYQQVDEAVMVEVTIHNQDVHSQPMLCLLSLHCSYRLAKCLFLSDSKIDHDRALSLSLKYVNNWEQLSHEMAPAAANWKAELLMLSSMIHFQRGEFQRSCQLIAELLEFDGQTHFSELELRFTTVLLVLRQLDASRGNESHREDLMEQMTRMLQRCYQIVEMWPGVGYYHGVISTSEAKSLLSNAPEGSFLVHQSTSCSLGNGTSTSRTDKDCITTRPLLLQVKLPDKIAALVLEMGSDALYHVRKLRNRDGHFSLHNAVKDLPASAGFVYALGVRKNIVCSALRSRLQCADSDGLEEREAGRRIMLEWSEWEHILADARRSNPDPSRRFRNETWSSVCLEVARHLESSQSWEFSLMAAREAVSHSRNRRRRAASYYLCARVSAQLSQRKDAELYIQHARLEAGIGRGSHLSSKLSFGLRTLIAVERGGGFFTSVYRSNREAFEARLDRVSKLERMCLKAWRFDSLATSLRGDSFSESLLLQRVQHEMYADCGDTFFLRSLLKAHVRAYLNNGRWYEDLHLELAFDCAARLVNSFHREQRERLQYKSGVGAQLSRMIDHTKSVRSTPPGDFSPRRFPLDLLLLSWHHLPFMLCFEIAEVLYRRSAYRDSKHHSVSLVDVYESLYGRLRGSKPRTMVYSAYEELLLLRLAFLHASNLKGLDDSLKHLSRAVECIDEILQLRKERAAVVMASTSLFSTPKQGKTAWLKKITWPTPIQVPIDLSDAEIVFIRGFLLETRENVLQTPDNHRKSWRSYRPLHDEVMHIVAKAQVHRAGGASDYRSSASFRAERLRGLRVYIGATHHVQLTDVLHSRPFVSIWCEGATIVSQTQPTWADLSPAWDEYVEFDVKSPNARIVVSLMDHHGRFSMGEPTVIGSATVFMQQLLESDSGTLEGQFIGLTPPKTGDFSRSSAWGDDNAPQLYLSFQVIVNSQPTGSATNKKTWRAWKRSGSWDVDDLRTNLHGDFRTFVASPWIWSRFAELFRLQHEFAIATWFFHKATALSSIPDDELRLEDIDIVVPVVRNLVGLAICQRATLCNSDWNTFGRPQVDHAASLLMVQENWDDFVQSHPLQSANNMEKELATVRSLLDLSEVGPFEQAVNLQIPASSQWIKVPKAIVPINSRRTPKTPALYYFNQDTGECFSSHAGSIPTRSPLEYEEEETIASHVDVSLSWLPRGVIIMDPTMKHRVITCRRQLEASHARDSFGWIAIYNARRQEMQFFSQHDPNTRCSGARRQEQPAMYVMLVDGHVLYHVLVIQDAFRRCQRRKQRRRLTRGIMRCAYWFARELLACRRRLFERSEAARKAALNCIYVHVESAHRLRAGDFVTSDPYVVLTLCDPDGQVAATGTTSVRRNTRNPKWNEEFYLPYGFPQHEQQQHSDQLNDDAKGEACLTLLVLDHDMIKTTRDEVDAGLPAGLSLKDFLGRSIIAIDAFQHGKRMTADLELLGPEDSESEDIDDDSDTKASSRKKQTKTRGLLTISVQWIHYEEHAWERRQSADGRYSIVRPRRSAADQKPPLPDSILIKFQSSREEIQPTVTSVVDLTVSTLNPLLRLHKRIRTAQAKGRTAEEAKVHEQRLAVIVSMQLAPQFVIVQQQLQHASAVLRVLLEDLRLPVMTYIEEAFDPVDGEAMRVTAIALLSPSSLLPSTCTTTAALASSLIALTPSDLPQPVIAIQLRHQEALTVIASELREWTSYLFDRTQNLANFMRQFFVPGHDMWPDAAIIESLAGLQSQLSTLVEQLTTKDNVSMTNDTEKLARNSGAPVSARQIEEKHRQDKEKAAVSLSKRKERIERERRKRARQ
jgi:hypothetical protein